MRLINADKLEKALDEYRNTDYQSSGILTTAFYDGIEEAKKLVEEQPNEFTEEELLEIQKLFFRVKPLDPLLNYRALNNALRKIQEELRDVKDKEV